MIRPRLIQVFGLVWLVTVLGGCNKGPELCPAGGTVKYQGEPVEGAVVTFRCQEANAIATGTTDSQGRFDLTTYQQGKGAVAGTHKVTVSKLSASGGPASGSLSMEEAISQGPPKEKAEPENLVPAKYGDPAQPLLEFTVALGQQNDFQIELTD